MTARGATAELTTAITAAVGCAAANHPGVRVAHEAFAERLRDFVCNEVEPVAALARLHVDDLYLAWACAEGDAVAIARLEREHFHQIPVAMAKLRLPHVHQDELLQRLRERLLVADPSRRPRIADYNGRGELAAWMRAVATHLVIDVLRASDREIASDDETFAQLAVAEDIGVVHLKHHYATAFRAALRDAMRELEPADRTELKLYYLDGVTLADLGAIDRVVPSTIARRIARTRETLLRRTRELMQTRLAIEASEMDSIFGLIASRMEVALSALEDSEPPQP